MTTTTNSTRGNPLGLDGIDFIEIASPKPEALRAMLLDLGFSRTMRHAKKAIDLYEQNDIRFLVNAEPASFAASFVEAHGPSVPSMGWRVGDRAKAFAEATRRGARPALVCDYDAPAVLGIGDSLLYLVDRASEPSHWPAMGFVPHPTPDRRPTKGFTAIDHLTNNVYSGTMDRIASFYKDVFGFTEVRTFDIRGKKTGLTSYALRSPCGKFCIPINQADEKKSQINEYLAEYRGPGVQHIALLTDDILASLDAIDPLGQVTGDGATSRSGLEFLDIEPGYYDEAFRRVTNVAEDRTRIRSRNVLVDGDESGYLLQIFTKNIMGPVFFELIQRRNHLSFGEGNFGALFRSIERDQDRRGVFRDEASP